MKTIMPFIIITFLSLFFLNSCFKANDNIVHDGRCTGSAYCTACKNCSRCGHCGSGRTCGVCSGGSSRKSDDESSSNRKKSTSSKKNTHSNTASTPKSKITTFNHIYTVPSNYYAKLEITNIRKGPGLEFQVIEKVKQGSPLIEIQKNGNWIKVKVKKTGTEGFVYFKDVKN